MSIAVFNHTTDGYIIFNGNFPMTLRQFLFLEPEYTLETGYSGRIFSPGQYHYLIRTEDSAQIPADVNWQQGIAYIEKLHQYKSILIARRSAPKVRESSVYDRSLFVRATKKVR